MLRRLLHTGTKEEYLDLLVLFMRISIAALMIRHGLPKLNNLFSAGEIQFGDPIGIGPAASLILVVFAEFFCSILIGIGLGSRLAAIPLMINMFVAALIAHGPDPFPRKELGLLYLLFYLVIFVTGSRKYSLDYLLTRKKN